MERYGWTITEVKQQPYYPLMELLNDDEENKEQEPEVITGSALKGLFGG
ncbi:hypothetical protein [Staphylococcus xylosus]|nr:hypothetical protein [Staphylococcus xylosus]MEB8101057.1 hypothetical protein [Staphylococcus xylosus]